MDLASIQDKIVQASRDGFAYAVNEFEAGASGIAVPIADIGDTQAVLGTTAPANHFARPGMVDWVVDILRRAAMTLRG